MSVISNTAASMVELLQQVLKPGEVLMVLSVAKSMVEKKPTGGSGRRGWKG
ncbi:hypothetical protein [Sporomusa sp.]|uniref:hypothetical protein n=1 Tax=Sporomusa sp. TaxID=2078658 RepID=UPI002B54035A|nr:hypothetical protein [Sporomusa sp.]HWR07786.1 hypothetical protein [Sporomusa sp.]